MLSQRMYVYNFVIQDLEIDNLVHHEDSFKNYYKKLYLKTLITTEQINYSEKSNQNNVNMTSKLS